MAGRLLFIDTETTGLVRGRPNPRLNPAKWPRIIELGWVLTDYNGEIIQKNDMIIRPDGFTIPAEATAIHGISTQTAQEKGIDIKIAMDAFLQATASADTIIAHNLWFDIGVLEAEGTRLGIRPIPAETKRVCTMLTSTDFCQLPAKTGNKYKWPGLAELYQILFGTGLTVVHRAADDASVCMQCYLELVKKGVINQ